MTNDDFTPEQLQALGLIRLRRREITASAAEENRTLLGIINSAADRRSTKRHRFMLLAGGIAGLSVPVMLQGQVAVDLSLVRWGSALLMFTVVVGAVFDAVDEWQTNPLKARAAGGIAREANLLLAEDTRLIASQANVLDPQLERDELAARSAVDRADADMRKAGLRFSQVALVEAVLFFGSFVTGVFLLMMAVGRATPEARTVRLGAEAPKYSWAFAQDMDNGLLDGELCRQSLAESLYEPANLARLMRQGSSNIFVFSGLVESYRIHGFQTQEACEAALSALANRQGRSAR